jgi:arginine/ornithine N-succinyltransferase beta subunit
MSPFVLQPATAEDLPELALIFQLAFEKDPNFSYLSAGTTLDDRVARGTLGYQKEFVKPGRRYFKVVDQENG